MDYLKLLIDATKDLGINTVAILVLLFVICTVTGILTKKLIDFLGHVVEIRRKIVDQVSQSRIELQTSRIELERVNTELRGLRSDVRELFKILSNLLGPLMYETYSEIIQRRALPKEHKRYSDD